MIDKLIKYIFILAIILSLSWCVSGIEITKATPENIAKWEIRKKEIIQEDICRLMEMEIQNFLDKQSMCSDSFRKVSSTAIFLSKLHSEIASLPENHREIGHIQYSIDTLICPNPTTITRWKQCPSGYDNLKK